MLNKILYSIILSLGLAACAHQTAPPSTTATAPKHNAALLVGKWHCQTPITENMNYVSDTTYHADGSSHDKGILTVQLSAEAKDLVWQFEMQTQSKWRIDGTHLIGRETTKPIVKLLPIENQSTRILLKAFEKSNPDVLETKKELLDGLSEFDDDEKRAKIITLNDKLFQAEIENDDVKALSNCQRI